MKIFISYKFTGEEITKLRTDLQVIFTALTELGHTYSCSLDNEELYKQNNASIEEIMSHELESLSLCDAVLLFVHSNVKSEGMLIEAGYAKAKNKPIVLAKQTDTQTHSINGIATEIIEFKSIDTLPDELKKSSILQ